MSALDKKNSFIWIMLFIVTQGLSNFILGIFLKAYNKEYWYAKPINWFLGAICFLYPLMFMLIILYIQICIECCRKLKVPGMRIYATPYSWIGCIILPFVGWLIGALMLTYVMVAPIFMLMVGRGNTYIESNNN